MNIGTNITRSRGERSMTAGLLNTQNLITVYWMLATQPELLSKPAPRHVVRSKHK